MCGIAAVIGLRGAPADAAAIASMTSSLVHRGPDEGGVHVAGHVAFGFRRLAILDLSPAARQPMVSEDGNLVLVFNGEIYNYIELRAELRELGHRFRSTGDTEVLLAAFQEWGPACLPRLNGMWAFLVYDRRRRTVFGARDRFGVKPLYVHYGSDYVLFASEIKALRASGLYADRPNWRTIASFLLQDRLDEGPASFYDGIEQVPPGTAFELDPSGHLRQWRYWSLADAVTAGCGDPVSGFADLFEEAVSLRMRSDVPVGVSLSGGLDSTSIICAAARRRAAAGAAAAHPLTAFSYMAPEFDESAYIDATVAQAQADLKPVYGVPLRLWEELPRILWFHDEPVHSMTALVGFQVMETAAAHSVRVMLSGQGADETLAGYANYFLQYWYTLLRRGDVGRLRSEIAAHVGAHGGSSTRALTNVLGYAGLAGLHRITAYRRYAARRRVAADRHHPWFTRDLGDHLEPDPSPPLDRTLDSTLARSVQHSPLPLYLRIEDRNSMAHSVETRLPFLDYRLVSAAFRLPAEWKMRGPWNKYILRHAMQGRIPESVRLRIDKMGFPVPSRAWLAVDVSDAVLDRLTSRQFREHGIFRVENIQRDLERHRRHETDVSRGLFSVVQFDVWSRMTSVLPPGVR